MEGFAKSYTADFSTGDIVGLGRYKRRLVAGLSSGMVKIWSKKSEELVNVGKIDRMRVYEDGAVFATGLCGLLKDYIYYDTIISMRL